MFCRQVGPGPLPSGGGGSQQFTIIESPNYGRLIVPVESFDRISGRIVLDEDNMVVETTQELSEVDGSETSDISIDLWNGTAYRLPSSKSGGTINIENVDYDGNDTDCQIGFTLLLEQTASSTVALTFGEEWDFGTNGPPTALPENPGHILITGVLFLTGNEPRVDVVRAQWSGGYA